MKKLNNHGWGLGTMLGFICFFVVIMLLIAIIAYNMGMSEQSSEHRINVEENLFVLPEDE